MPFSRKLQISISKRSSLERNFVGDPHCKLAMLENESALQDFKKLLGDYGFSISALSCHGNALHPDKARAQHDREISHKTILLAEKLGVPVTVDFSGCPGDSPNATAPNWVTCPWPPDFGKVLQWQWNEWSRRTGFSMQNSPLTTA